MKNLFLTVFLFSAITAAAAEPEDGTIRIPLRGWTAWGHDTPIRISVKNSEITFLRANGKPGWNTPIYEFPAGKRPLITALTFLKFEYRVSRSRRMDLNLRNETEGNEYAVAFQAEVGGWKTAAVHLNSAAYKRGGRSGIRPDGMTGDRLASFQVAFSGTGIELRNICLYEADPNDPGLIRKKNAAVESYIKNRQVPSYRQFRNGAVFPFGVIHTVRFADQANGIHFSQDLSERQQENLRLIRLAGFNCYSNFNEVSSETISRRLDRLKEFDLHLLETKTCSSGISRLKKDAPLFGQIREAAHHPNLLAFYGQDEPADSALYLRNKIRIEEFAGDGAPLTSAMHMMSVAAELGPAMDVIAVDPYSINAALAPGEAANVLNNQANLIRNARNYAAGKRVWFIGQGFSYRLGGRETYRFPSEAEIRYEAFNAIAAGANGYFCFIWQGEVPYLRADSRKGESFDLTLCDPWGNLSGPGKALGETARRIVPVMSFFLDRKLPEKCRKTRSPDVFSLSEWQGEYGTLFIAVNQDLFHARTGKVQIPLRESEKLYDLENLCESGGRITLNPGDGIFLCAASPEQFARLRERILERRQAEAVLREKLSRKEAPELRRAREALGKMNRRMLGKLKEFDGNAAMDPLRSRIRALSKEYFDALREFRKTGNLNAGSQTLAVRADQLGIEGM